MTYGVGISAAPVRAPTLASRGRGAATTDCVCIPAAQGRAAALTTR